jgi:FkbM family methyltransferase
MKIQMQSPDDVKVTFDLTQGRDSFDQRAIQRHGLKGLYPCTTAAILSLAQMHRSDSLFLDIGANGGIYSLLVKAFFRRHHVFAYEPDPRVAAVIERLSRLNDLPICVQRVAVSDRRGSSKLYISAKSDASTSLVEGFRDARDIIEVKVVTLSDLLRYSSKPFFMKIDVETHEFEVLMGGLEKLKKARPYFVLEIGEDEERKRDTIGLLQSIGYGSLLLQPDVELPTQEDDVLRDYLIYPDETSRESQDLLGHFKKLYSSWLRQVLLAVSK